MKIETLIYLFFIILTIIAPLLRKKKKAPVNKPVNKPVEQPQPDDFFKTLEKKLNEWAKENEAAPVLSEYDEEQAVSKDAEVDGNNHSAYENYEENIESFDNQAIEVFSYDETYQKNMADSLSSLSQLKPEPASEITDSKNETSRLFHFNAIEAIIYSEILKRPEY